MKTTGKLTVGMEDDLVLVLSVRKLQETLRHGAVEIVNGTISLESAI